MDFEGFPETTPGPQSKKAKKPAAKTREDVFVAKDPADSKINRRSGRTNNVVPDYGKLYNARLEKVGVAIESPSKSKAWKAAKDLSDADNEDFEEALNQVTDEDEQSETERALPAKPVKIKKGKEKEVLTYESEEEFRLNYNRNYPQNTEDMENLLDGMGSRPASRQGSVIRTGSTHDVVAEHLKKNKQRAIPPTSALEAFGAGHRAQPPGTRSNASATPEALSLGGSPPPLSSSSRTRSRVGSVDDDTRQALTEISAAQGVSPDGVLSKTQSPRNLKHYAEFPQLVLKACTVVMTHNLLKYNMFPKDKENDNMLLKTLIACRDGLVAEYREKGGEWARLAVPFQVTESLLTYLRHHHTSIRSVMMEYTEPCLKDYTLFLPGRSQQTQIAYTIKQVARLIGKTKMSIRFLAERDEFGCLSNFCHPALIRAILYHCYGVGATKKHKSKIPAAVFPEQYFPKVPIGVFAAVGTLLYFHLDKWNSGEARKAKAAQFTEAQYEIVYRKLSSNVLRIVQDERKREKFQEHRRTIAEAGRTGAWAYLEGQDDVDENMLLDSDAESEESEPIPTSPKRKKVKVSKGPAAHGKPGRSDDGGMDQARPREIQKARAATKVHATLDHDSDVPNIPSGSGTHASGKKPKIKKSS